MRKFYNLPGKNHPYTIMTIQPMSCGKKGRSQYYFEYHEFSGVKFLTFSGKSHNKQKVREIKKPPQISIDIFNNWLENVKKRPELLWKLYKEKNFKIEPILYKCQKCDFVFLDTAFLELCNVCASPNIKKIEKKYYQGRLF